MSVITLNNRHYDFSKFLPKVNGITLRSNIELAREIHTLLDSINYRFDFNHPEPAILRNYQNVERKCLIVLLRNLVNQISVFPTSIHDLFIVTSSGFAISLGNSKWDRICRIYLHSDERKILRIVPLSQVSNIVETWLKSSLTNKSIEIV